jgi:hypothetical protein
MWANDSTKKKPGGKVVKFGKIGRGDSLRELTGAAASLS